MEINILYQDNDVLVIDKPAGLVVFPEGKTIENTLIDVLLEKYPDLKNVGESPRYGIVHRLDKDTSGLLIIAKTAQALIFFQKQFKNRTVEKKYLALVDGVIKDSWGTVHTLLGRSKNDPRKQRTYSLDYSDKKGKREAFTAYKVLKRYSDYTLLEVAIKTGRRHQIRCHLAFIHHPVVGDALYSFKDSARPDNLARQFLHAQYLKVTLPSGQVKEFHSPLPQDLQNVINKLKI